jgi:hypothetical protein
MSMLLLKIWPIVTGCNATLFLVLDGDRLELVK